MEYVFNFYPVAIGVSKGFEDWVEGLSPSTQNSCDELRCVVVKAESMTKISGM